MDLDQEDRESVTERWKGQVKKLNEIVRLADEVICEYKDGSAR
jgi:hypothetical protein